MSFISLWKTWSNLSLWATVKWCFQSPMVPNVYNMKEKVVVIHTHCHGYLVSIVRLFLKYLIFLFCVISTSTHLVSTVVDNPFYFRKAILPQNNICLETQNIFDNKLFCTVMMYIIYTTIVCCIYGFVDNRKRNSKKL